MEENILKDKLKKITMKHYCYLFISIVILLVTYIIISGGNGFSLYTAPIDYLFIIINVLVLIASAVCFIGLITGVLESDYYNSIGIKSYHIVCCCIVVCLVCLCGVVYCNDVVNSRPDDVKEWLDVNNYDMYYENDVASIYKPTDEDVVVVETADAVEHLTYVLTYGENDKYSMNVMICVGYDSSLNRDYYE